MIAINRREKFCMNHLDNGKKRNRQSGVYPDAYLYKSISLEEIFNLG